MTQAQIESLEAIYPVRSAAYAVQGYQNDGSYYDATKSHDWNTKTIEIKTATCMFTQVLNDRFQKRLTKLTKENVKLEDIDNLNELLNSEITSIRREGKLNQILMNE